MVCVHLYERRKLRRIIKISEQVSNHRLGDFAYTYEMIQSISYVFMSNSYVFITISYVFLRFSYVFAFVVIRVVRIRVGIDKRISIRLYGIPRQSAQENLSYSRVCSENQYAVSEMSAISCAILQEILCSKFSTKNRWFVPNCCTNLRPHKHWVFEVKINRNFSKSG